MNTRHVIPLIAAAIATLVVATPRDADAKLLFGADAGVTVALGDWSVKPDGPGFEGRLRLGYQLPVPVIRIVPEILGSYATFPADDVGNASQTGLSGRGGLRVGIGGLIGPALFAHVGYSRVHGEASDYTVTTSGLSYDVGLSVDFTLIPLLNIGVHGGYNVVTEENKSAQWIDAGVHVELVF